MALADITENDWASYQESYEKLRENEELYRVALSLTDHTVTVVDIPNKTLNQIYNEGDWTGVASSMPDAPESIIAAGIIHPEDEEGYRKFFQDIYAGVPKNECTMRVMGENRGWVWFTMYAQTVFAEDGTPLKAIAFSDDITARKKAEIMYDQYRAAVTRDANYIWEVNLDQDSIIEEDEVSKQLFGQKGFTKFSEISAVAFETVPEEHRSRVREAFSIESLLAEFQSAKREVSLDYPFVPATGGEEMWMRSTAYMTSSPEGDVNAIICVRDITQRRKEEERLRQEAERDPLCGLFNRKTFEQKVVDQLSNDRRTQSGHLFMIDVDDFKEVNDENGHVFGDEVLQSISDVLRKFFRSEDVLGRVGGDEFMAFVSNIDSAIAAIRAQKIGDHLRAFSFSQEIVRPVTLSIGIAKAVSGIDNFESLYKKADGALYRAKENGKGCWAVWEEKGD